MSQPRRWLVGFGVACASCAAEPLPSPLSASRVVQDGIRLWLADSDLAGLAATARALAGSEVPLVTAPYSVPATGGAQLGPLHTAIRLESATAVWQETDRLRFGFQVEAGTLPLALGYPGAAACALSFAWPQTPLVVDLRLGEVGKGPPQATLAAPPQWPSGPFELDDPQGCLQGLSAQSVEALQTEVWQEVRGAAAGRATVGAAGAVQALLDGPWPLASRFVGAGTPTDWQIEPMPRGLGSSAAFVAGPPDQHFARLALGADAARHPCAPDVPPPALAVEWPTYPAAPPAGAAVARRGLALHAAGLAHLGWVALRSGLLCRSSGSWGEPLGEGWATPIAPALQAWVDGPPKAARLWPGATPVVEVVDGALGAELSWRLDDATLEVVASVAGEEAVVLAVRGQLRIRTKVVGLAAGLRLEPVGVTLESATVSSPLFGEALPPGSSGDVRALVQAAVTGLVAELPAFPLTAILPPGTTLTGTARGGNALWLWLDSSPL